MYKKLYNLEYVHRGYTTLYISEPKVRKIEKSRYIDRIVHRFIVDNYLQPVFGVTYIYGSFACIQGKGMHKSAIKDGSTNEILAYELSKSLEINIVLNTIEKLKNNRNVKLTRKSFIHSDQVAHYTSPKFQNAVKNLNIGQSMSRRGNCWDNAPQKSFFGHMKYETNIKECKNYEELEKEIKSYMNYYNKTRGQWNLKKMTPIEYRNHLLGS